MNPQFSMEPAALGGATSARTSRRRVRPTSFTTIVSSLTVGETASRAIQVDDNLKLADFTSAVAKLREDVRNNVAPCIRRARQAVVDATFTVEVEELLTGRGKLFLVALVTRVT